MSNKKYYIVVVNAVIINNENKILISKRSDDEDVLPGFYCVPGGKVEEGKNTLNVLETAIKREVREEVGIEVEVLDMFDSHIGKEDGNIHIYFKCKHVSGTPTALDGTAEVYWMTLEEIKKLDKKSPMLYENCLKAINSK